MFKIVQLIRVVKMKMELKINLNTTNWEKSRSV